MSSNGRFVGLDFGGTSIKVGAVDEQGRVLDQGSAPIELAAGAEHVLDQAAELARDVGVGSHLGVGCAGIFDPDTGVLLESPNLRALDGVDLAGGLGRRLDIDPRSIPVENDANVAAVGEQWQGAARGVEDVLVLTLGTGIGGGLILGGELFAGATGKAAEVGHVVIDSTGPRCGCGNLGCLETFASATAARRRALEAGLPAGDPGNLELLSERARAGEADERSLLVDIGRDLGHGVSYTVNLLDIDCFVFGGGFAGALDLLEPGIRAGLGERVFGERQVRLLGAELGGSAGWIGAARLSHPG